MKIKQLVTIAACAVLVMFGVAQAVGWSCGSSCSKKIVFSEDGTADFDMAKVMNGYMMPVSYVSSADDSVVVTLIGADTGRDYLDGNGTLAAATTPGVISPDDRWPIGETLVPTVTGLGSGTLTLIFAVAK